MAASLGRQADIKRQERRTLLLLGRRSRFDLVEASCTFGQSFRRQTFACVCV